MSGADVWLRKSTSQIALLPARFSPEGSGGVQLMLSSRLLSRRQLLGWLRGPLRLDARTFFAIGPRQRWNGHDPRLERAVLRLGSILVVGRIVKRHFWVRNVAPASQALTSGSTSPRQWSSAP